MALGNVTYNVKSNNALLTLLLQVTSQFTFAT